MPFSLKRLAKYLGLSSRGEPVPDPIPLSGWNRLPEDILILLIKDYLGINSTSAHSLSMTCRAFASLFRPHLFFTVCIPGHMMYDPTSKKSTPSSIVRLTRDLTANPRLCERIGTLRVINDRAGAPGAGILFQIPVKRGSTAPSLTAMGQTLVGVLTQWRFPNLHTFELPLLRWDHQWSSLALPLQGAIRGFLQRHAESLKELSVTMQYPLELVRYCGPGLTKLEYRVEGAIPDFDPSESSAVGKGLVGARAASGDHRPIILEKLVVMGSGGGLDNEVAKQFRGPSGGELYISLERLKKLTYYLGTCYGPHLPPLLNHCAHTLTSLGIYVSNHVNGPTLRNILPALHRLEHLTLSINHWWGVNAGTLPWISNTIEDFFDPNVPRVPPLQTLKIVVSALGQTVEECVQEMDEGWMAFTIKSLGRAASAASISTSAQRHDAYPNSPSPRWCLKNLRVVVCLRVQDPRHCSSPVHPSPSEDEQSILLARGLKTRLVDGISKFDPAVTVDVEVVRDRFSRWLRYPSIRWAPLHY